MERFDILDAVYDVLAVQMAQLYFRNVFCLNLIDAKALHEARNDVGFLFGLAHYLYRFVYVEKYLSETAQKVKLVGLLFEVEAQLALYAVHAELYPLAEYLADTHLTRCRADQHVEVAGEIVLKRSEPVELCHELLGICAAPQIKRQLESGEVDFVAEVHDLLQLSVLDERCDLCEYLLDRGGIRYLENVDAVVLLVVAVSRAQSEASAPGAVNVEHFRTVVYQIRAAREIGSLYDVEQLFVRRIRTAQKLDRSVAYLGEVEGAYR